MTPSSSDLGSGRDKSNTQDSAAVSKVVASDEFETLSTESGTHVVQAGADLMVRFRVPENPETEATRRKVRIQFSWHVQAPKQQIGFAVCACEPDGSLPQLVKWKSYAGVTEAAPHRGDVVVPPKAGEYAAVWDNSHSWYWPHTLSYTISMQVSYAGVDGAPGQGSSRSQDDMVPMSNTDEATEDEQRRFHVLAGLENACKSLEEASNEAVDFLSRPDA